MFGPRRLGDAFAVLGMTGDAPATWKLTKCTRAPDLSLALPRGTAPPKPKLEKLTCLEDKGWKAGDPASRRKQSFGGESSDDEDNIIMKRKGRSNDQRKAEDEQQIDSSSSSRCPKVSMPGSDEEDSDFGRLFYFSKESSQRIQQRRKSKGDSIHMNHIKAVTDDHIMQPGGANAIQSNMIVRKDSLDKPQPQRDIIQKGPITNQQEQQRDIRGPVGNQQPPPGADALLGVVTEYCKNHPEQSFHDAGLGSFRCILTWMQNGVTAAENADHDGTFQLPGKAFLAAALNIDKSNQSPRQGVSWIFHYTNSLRVFDNGKRTRHLTLVVADDVLMKKDKLQNLAAGDSHCGSRILGLVRPHCGPRRSRRI
jgi:hypothetical protein